MPKAPARSIDSCPDREHEPELADLLVDPASVADVSVGHVYGLLAELDADEGRRATVRALLLARIAGQAPAPGGPALLDEEGLLTDDQVAESLSIPTGYVSDLRKSGELPGVPVGEKYIRTRRSELRTYIAGLPNASYSRRQRKGRSGRENLQILETKEV